MVRSIFRFFYKETTALQKAAYFLGFFALLSQVMAFLRDRLLAHAFGAGSALDAYYAAFRIPDFLFVTVASIVSLSVIVPFIIEKEKEGKEAVREFIDNIFSFFSLLIIVVSVVAFFIIPSLSSVLFKGFTGPALDEVILLSRIFLISPIALGFSNLFGSLTQAYNRFLVYAFAPLLYNLGIIAGILFLAPKYGVVGVAVGVAVGSILHMLIQIPFVVHMGLFPRIRPRFDFNSIRKVATLSFPRTLSLSTNHIATIFLISIASMLPVGSISVYSFALNIQSVPLSIIGVSYSLAAFPTLSRYFANKDMKAFVGQMADSLRQIIFWSLPAMALFIVLRAPIVRVLLGTGRFNWSDTRLTAAALALFSISALSQSLLLLFTRAFYSAGHTRKPFFINLISALVLIVVTYGCVYLYKMFPEFQYFINALLKVEDVPNTIVLMLPLGYSIGTILNGIVHWIGFEKDFGKFPSRVLRTLFESVAAAVIMGFVAHMWILILGPFIGQSSLARVFLGGFFAGILGIISWACILFLLKSKELEESWDTIHSKFWKTEAIRTDAEIA
ncbi:MAG: hypothetical protein JWL80_292 [Parcubacteria group bacterium]|nr:hypothetical protein [Parcubacteria group bacterium]